MVFIAALFTPSPPPPRENLALLEEELSENETASLHD